MMFQFAKFTFCLLVIAGVVSSEPPDSPCPELFQYKFDGSDWIGLIELNNIKVDQTVINIIVEFSLPTSLPSLYKGRLDLLEEKQQAVQAVLSSKPLFYRITFPLKNPIPRVTQIAVDNEVVCSGPPDQSPQMTRFQLHHVFYPKKSGHPSISERIPNDGSPCELTDGTSGMCTIVSKCSEIYKGSIAYEELEKIRCGFVDGKDFVCCKDPDPPTGRRAKDACADSSETTYDSFRTDVPVVVGEFPYMVILGYSSVVPTITYTWKCPAALISDQYLLTSAHCVVQYRPSVARLGYVSLAPVEGFEALLHFTLINEVNIHPNYMYNRLYHDIALVKLKEKVNFTENIRPACLNTNQTRLPPETNVVFVKWEQKVLAYARLDLTKKFLKSAEFSNCNQSHVNIRKLPNGLTEDHMCVFDPELVEGCEQDSEGFVQIYDSIGKFILYGATTFVGGCAFSLPGVYTRISNNIDWIESIVWPYTSTKI